MKFIRFVKEYIIGTDIEENDKIIGRKLETFDWAIHLRLFNKFKVNITKIGKIDYIYYKKTRVRITLLPHTKVKSKYKFNFRGEELTVDNKEIEFILKDDEELKDILDLTQIGVIEIRYV